MRSKFVSLLLVVLLVSSAFAGGVMAQESGTQGDDSQQQDGQEDGSQTTGDSSDGTDSSSSDSDSESSEDGSDSSESGSESDDSSSSESDSEGSSEANENQINTDKVVKTIGDGAVVVHDVRTYGDRVEIDLSTNRYQTISISKIYEQRWDTDVHTVGSGTHTIVVNDVSGVEKLGVGVNQQGKYVKVDSGLTLLPQIDSVLALFIGVVVVFLGLIAKAKRRDSNQKQKIEVMR